MVVALCALNGQPQKGRSHRLDATEHVPVETLFRKNGPPFKHKIEPIEAGGDLLFPRGRLVQITGDLVATTAVERQIVIEGANDPGPVYAEVTVSVCVQSIGVGQTHQISPVARHVLTVLWTREQCINTFRIGIRRRVRIKRGELLKGWRQPRQVESQTTKQCTFIRHRIWLKRGGLEPGIDIAINRTVAPLAA